MIKPRSLTLVLSLAALLGAEAALARKPLPPPAKQDAPVAKKSDEAAKPAQPGGTPVEYAELEQQVGAEISVETTLNTVRRGVLTRYTGPALTLKLGPQMGSIDFTVPRETVRTITLITPAQKPAAKEAGSAKKN